jgi:superfamily I DNA/RNA helicase
MLPHIGREIRMWAVAVMNGVTVDDLDESTDDLRGYRSLFHGPVPDVVLAGSFDQQLSSLIEWIEECKNERIEEEDICVLAARNDLVKREAEALHAKGYDVVILQPRKADDRTKSGIRLGTMHRSKGLEFAAVAIVDLNDGVIMRWALENAADPAIRRGVIDASKSLLHVSATRAKKRLFVSSSGTPSELIAHLDAALAAE